MLDRFTGGPSSGGDCNVADCLVLVRVMVGTVSLLVRRPGITLFLMPRPVKVSPLSGSRMGCCTALPVLSMENSDSISLRRDVKLASHNGMTSSGSGGGSG